MRTLWQVEQNEYRRRVLARHFPDAERFEDVRTVGAHNLADVDLICGGFPCQDISVAGRGGGLAGARSGLWSEFARIIGELGPRYVVVENVPALAARGLGRVLRDLAALGYDAEWDCLPAAAFGAPHQRDRLWLVAYPNGDGVRLIAERDQREGWEVRAALGGYTVAPHDGAPRAVADASRLSEGRTGAQSGAIGQRAREGSQRGGTALADAEVEPVGPGLREGEPGGLRRGRPSDRSGEGNPWATEPDVGRVADGIPARVDRLSALGDALVPQIAEWIGRRILAHGGAEGDGGL